MSRRASWWPGVGRGSSVPPGFPDPHPASDPDVTLVDPDADLVPGGHDATAVDPDGRPLRPGEPGAAVVAPVTAADPDLVLLGDDSDAAIHHAHTIRTPDREPDAALAPPRIDPGGKIRAPEPGFGPLPGIEDLTPESGTADAVHPGDARSRPEPDADFDSDLDAPDTGAEVELAALARGFDTGFDHLDDRPGPEGPDDDLEPAEPASLTRFGTPEPRRRRRRRGRGGPRQVRRPGQRARGAAAFSSIWPGMSETSAPPGFYAESADGPETDGATTGSVTAVGRSRSATTTEPSASPTSPRPPLGLRSVGKVAAAVYAALGDPLVGASEAARARRAARVRAVGSAAAMAVLLVLLIYGIFPVRAYLDQRSATQRATEQLEVISRENQRLAEEAEDLRQPEMVEEIARRDHGLVFPGEESYGVLPPPVPTTTTTTTTTTLPVLP